MKNVLIISYRFPPRSTVGAQRMGGLARHLPKYGWQPIILTAKLPKAPSPIEVLPLNLKVVQTRYFDLIAMLKGIAGFRKNVGLYQQLRVNKPRYGSQEPLCSKFIFLTKSFLAFPDPEIGWYNYAVIEGEKVLKQYKIGAIISSSSPATSHLIAKKLKVKYQVPWIADLRDLWTQHHYYRYGRFRFLLERWLEKRTLSHADALVTVSKPLAHKLESLHVDKPIYSIPNGFEPDEFEKKEDALTDKFTITYTGGLYDGKQDPILLFQVLAKLIEENRLNPSKLQIRFYGPLQLWLIQLIKQYNLNQVVKVSDRIPRDEVLKRQKESTILLLLNWNDPDEMGVYTSKVFEYLGAQRPILALGGPGGVVKELLNETKAGINVSNAQMLKKLLISYYNEYMRTGTVVYKGLKSKIDKYTYQAMTQKFVHLLSSVIRKGNPGCVNCER